MLYEVITRAEVPPEPSRRADSAQVRAEASLEELEAYFARHDEAAVPVVDAHQALLGVVRLTAALLDRGFGPDEVRKVMGGT